MSFFLFKTLPKPPTSEHNPRPLILKSLIPYIIYSLIPSDFIAYYSCWLSTSWTGLLAVLPAHQLCSHLWEVFCFFFPHFWVFILPVSTSWNPFLPVVYIACSLIPFRPLCSNTTLSEKLSLSTLYKTAYILPPFSVSLPCVFFLACINYIVYYHFPSAPILQNISSIRAFANYIFFA